MAIGTFNNEARNKDGAPWWIHVLPRGFHRIRHYGLLAKTSGADNIALARELLAAQNTQSEPADTLNANHNEPTCPRCGDRVIIIETFGPLPAVSCLGGFGTPTPYPRNTAVAGRDPKTFTSGDIVRPFQPFADRSSASAKRRDAEMVH